MAARSWVRAVLLGQSVGSGEAPLAEEAQRLGAGSPERHLDRLQSPGRTGNAGHPSVPGAFATHLQREDLTGHWLADDDRRI